MDRRSPSPKDGLNQRLSRVFDRQAPAYARRRRRTDCGRGAEAAWRRRLLEPAQGNVLEVAIGAGPISPSTLPASR